MAQYGLGNYLYEVGSDGGGSAVYHFFDPNDASNSAEVTIAQKDFPDGVTSIDARQVAELAFTQIRNQMDDKRDARLAYEAADELEAKQETEARAREAANDFFATSQELADTTPTGTVPETPAPQLAPAHNSKPQDSVEDSSKAPTADKKDKKK